MAGVIFAQQLVDHLAGGGGRGLDPVDVAVPAVVVVMIDVDDRRAGRPGLIDQAFGASRVRAVGEDDQVERSGDRIEPSIPLDAGEEGQHLGRRMRAPGDDRPPSVDEGQIEREERAQDVCVGVDVAEHEGPPAPPAKGCEDGVSDWHRSA